MDCRQREAVPEVDQHDGMAVGDAIDISEQDATGIHPSAHYTACDATQGVEMSVDSFAEELRRLLSGVDVAGLAAVLGVSERTVRSWARAERSTSPEVVFALERRLSVAPGTLSRHLGYLPLGSHEAEGVVASRIAAQVREDAGRYRYQAAPDVARLVDRVDEATAARRGLQLELMRVAVEDFQSEHGPLTEEEIAQARRDLASVIDRSTTA